MLACISFFPLHGSLYWYNLITLPINSQFPPPPISLAIPSYISLIYPTHIISSSMLLTSLPSSPWLTTPLTIPYNSFFQWLSGSLPSSSIFSFLLYLLSLHTFIIWNESGTSVRNPHHHLYYSGLPFPGRRLALIPSIPLYFFLPYSCNYDYFVTLLSVPTFSTVNLFLSSCFILLHHHV